MIHSDPARGPEPEKKLGMVETGQIPDTLRGKMNGLTLGLMVGMRAKRKKLRKDPRYLT